MASLAQLASLHSSCCTVLACRPGTKVHLRVAVAEYVSIVTDILVSFNESRGAFLSVRLRSSNSGKLEVRLQISS